jgi:4-amino-4-deoxy-L-arabinose transferase-like glycosyltransferase
VAAHEPERRAGRAHWIAFVAILALCAGFRLSFLVRSSPYPLHEDEGYLTRAAARMVRERDPNPRFFRYPSLPIYLTAGAFLVGQALDDDQGDGRESVGRVVRPYYTRARVVGAARVLFALLSVGAMGLAAVAAWRAFGEPLLLVLSPLVLSFSDRYLLQSWAYLNVDIVGAFVCGAALAVLFRWRERTTFVHRALLPGVLTGLAVGSKYYLGLVGLPFALVLLAPRHRERLARNAAGIVTATMLGFLASTPYAVLDASSFTAELTREVEHYQAGHEGGEEEPGLPQLAYYLGQLRAEFGAGALVLALAGVVVGLRKRPVATGLFVAFPLALLGFLCVQRVHFPRNMTSFYLLFPGLVAFGAIASSRGLEVALRGRVGRSAPFLAGSLVALAAAPFLPWRDLVRAHSVPVDSRNAVQAWIHDNVEPGRRVFIAAELQMDTSGLAVTHDVVEAPLVDFVVPGMARQHGALRPVFVLPTIEPGSRLEVSYGDALRPAAGLDEKGRWGRNGVPRVRTVLVHMGDPRLAVYEFPGESDGEGGRQ